MSAKRRSWVPWVLLALLLAAVLWADAARRGAVVKAEAQTDSAQALRGVVDSLRALERRQDTVYAGRVDTLRQWRTRWDSVLVPGATDTVTVERVVQLADSTIRACEAVVATCEERVATARERGDSAERMAEHWQEAAAQWKKSARGPFIRPAVEGTLTPALAWQAAGEVTVGRGRFKVLGRLEVGNGAETCAFTGQSEVYQCSTPTEAVARFGVRWGL